MKSQITVQNHSVILELEGSIYVEEAASIREQLLQYLEKGHHQFVIRMAKVDYIDSSGLGVLVAIQKRALQHGGGVVIEGIYGLVQELFELTRLTKVFEIR